MPSTKACSPRNPRRKTAQSSRPSMPAFRLGPGEHQAERPRFQRGAAMEKTTGKILVDGNDRRGASARSSRGVQRRLPWYPITPSSSVDRVLHRALSDRYRVDPETEEEERLAIVQAEDELAAIGMVLGAGWAGARCHDLDQRPGHQSHERVRGSQLLRRDPRRDHQRAARRSEHGSCRRARCRATS